MTDYSAIQVITRPDSKLLTNYIIHSFLWGPAFLYPLVTKIIRYRTLQYQFDEDGISMSWGRLSRREIRVNYQAIQDIHLRSDVVERYLGLARIEVQTASGEAAAELTLEGIPQFNELRDFLLQKMQATRHKSSLTSTGPAIEPSTTLGSSADVEMIAATLQEVAIELRALRAILTNQKDENEGPNE